VVRPRETIPRAIPLALGITLLIYGAVISAALIALGPEQLASATAPLVDATRAGGLEALVPVVRAGAAVASLSVLISLLAGVSRTVFAMARQRDLPAWLDAVHPTHRVPHRAEYVIGAIVATLAVTLDLRAAIGFSSFAVLFYYAVANASAWTLSSTERRWPRCVAAVGFAGCLVLAWSLPTVTVFSGALLFLAGLVVYFTGVGQRRPAAPA
jgi:APA family basic amino acid/polyamine antiporter